jgi:hypothetical protein
MSTSPDEPQKESLFSQTDLDPVSTDFRKLMPLKNLLWAGLIIAGVILLGIYWATVWNLLAEFVPLALESMEEALDTVFEAMGLSPAIAQMATAYTGFVGALVALYFVIRKSMILTRRTRERVSAYRDVYSTFGKRWWGEKRAAWIAWWNTLDWLQKIATAGALILIGIPLALLLSVILGSIVASLL